MVCHAKLYGKGFSSLTHVVIHHYYSFYISDGFLHSYVYQEISPYKKNKGYIVTQFFLAMMASIFPLERTGVLYQEFSILSQLSVRADESVQPRSVIRVFLLSSFYCAGSSLAWGLNLRAVVCGIF